METKLGHWRNYFQWCVYCIYVLHFHIKDAEVSLPFLTSPLIGSFRASISRDPFYDMLATRKRRIANKKWSLHPNRFPKSNTHCLLGWPVCVWRVQQLKNSCLYFLSCVSMRLITQLSWSVCICMDVYLGGSLESPEEVVCDLSLQMSDRKGIYFTRLDLFRRPTTWRCDCTGLWDISLRGRYLLWC